MNLNIHNKNRIRLTFIGILILFSLCSANASPVEDLILWSNRGDTKKVEALLKRRANPNAKNDWGYTALMWAAHRGHVNVCKILLAKGAKPNITDKCGRTALLMAAATGTLELGGTYREPGYIYHYLLIVELLLKAGANPDIVDTHGNRALFLPGFLCRESQAICKALIRKGANINVRKSDGETILVQAAREGDHQLIRLILSKKPSQEDKDAALREACKKSVWRMVEPGVDILKESCQIIEWLLKAGANPNTTNQNKESPLILLHLNNLPAAEQTRLLLKHGAKVEAVDADGGTALVYATWREDAATLQILLENGANPNVKLSVQGKTTTPLAIARQKGNTEIIEILEKAGAVE